MTSSDTIKIYDNQIESVEFVEKDLMKSGSINFNPIVDSAHVDTYVQSASINTLTTNFTIEFWIYLEKGSRYNGGVLTTSDHAGLMLNFGGQTSYVWYILGGTYGYLRCNFNLNGTLTQYQQLLPYNIKSSWHHIAITYDATTLLFYLDGTQFGTFTQAGYLRNGTSSFRLGNITTYWLHGDMADVRIWNTTRTADEISGNMKNRLEGNETGLIYYLPMNDGSGTTAKEIVVGNNGTLTNTTWTDTTPPIPNVKFTSDYKIIASEFVESDTETSPFRMFPDKVQSRKIKEHYLTDVITDGLILWLDAEDFTNTPQTTKWRDRSGLGNHAIVNNFAYTTTSGNNGLGKVTFDGTNDYLEISNSSSLNPTAITIEVRFKYKTRSVWNFLACKRTAGTNGYLLYLESSTGEVANDWGGNGDRWNTGYIAPLNTELTLTVTCTAGKRILYVNGQYQAQTTAVNTSLVSTTSPLRISKNTLAENDWVSMDFRYMRIYNRVLTADEVLSNYNAGLKS